MTLLDALRQWRATPPDQRSAFSDIYTRAGLAAPTTAQRDEDDEIDACLDACERAHIPGFAYCEEHTSNDEDYAACCYAVERSMMDCFRSCTGEDKDF